MLTPGAESYYLAVGSTGALGRADEYYTSEPENPGEWVGAGSAALGLAGGVTAADLRAVLAGAPSGQPARSLVSAAPPSRRSRPGMYLTFSAPKGVSLLAFAGDDRHSAAAVRKHTMGRWPTPSASSSVRRLWSPAGVGRAPPGWRRGVRGRRLRPHHLAGR